MTFAHALAQYPNLTAFGWQDPSDPDFAKNRKELEADRHTFDIVMTYLRMCGRPPCRTSYRFKHLIERAVDHQITNGVGMLAALAHGLKFRRIDGPNGIF